MADFNPDKYNKYQGQTGGESGLSAGVQSGLSSVEKLPRGVTQPEQVGHGVTFRQQSSSEPAGSENGKSFTINY